MTELSVVIPTRDRCAVLLEALARLDASTAAGRFEVIVVDDGSRDGTVAAAEAAAGGLSYPLAVHRGEARGPAAARNAGTAAAGGGVVLFLGDDAWATPELVERHLAFHAERPGREHALLGRAVWDPGVRATPFMRWLDEGGVQFDFGALARGDELGGRRFYTVNVSAKTGLLRAVGGFDEGFPDAAGEDVELGLRLEAAGMRLAYDPDALVHHHHPTDLEATLRRMSRVGAAVRRLRELHPEVTVPRPPGLRHRVKAAGLEVAWRGGLRSEAFRREVWRFLCHQAHREALYHGPAEDLPRTGRRLARAAVRDPAAAAPAQPSAVAARARL